MQSLNPVSPTKSRYIQCCFCNYVQEIPRSFFIPKEAYCPNCGKLVELREPTVLPNTYDENGKLIALNQECIKPVFKIELQEA